MVKIENKEDVEDFVRGCTFLGTGGGGLPKEGKKWLIEDIEEGKTIELEDLENISDEEWFVCPFMMGSIAPESEEVKKKKESLGLTEEVYDRPLVKAIEVLEKYMGIYIAGVIPVELGGANTPGPVDAAAQMSKTIVDADYAGRAIPEIEQITPNIFDKKLAPISTVDKYGNIAIIKTAINSAMTERIGKSISDASFGLNGDAGILLKGRELKEIAIGGTLSECYKIGRIIKEAREAGEDPVRKTVDEVNGWFLFEGEVTDKDWWDKEGYMWGENTITGTGDFEGHKLKIWFKNENHITWLDDEPYVTSPDIIEVVERDTGEPIVNTDIAEGDKVAVIAMKGRELFRTEKGLEALGPKHFDFDIEYKPIEEVLE